MRAGTHPSTALAGVATALQHQGNIVTTPSAAPPRNAVFDGGPYNAKSPRPARVQLARRGRCYAGRVKEGHAAAGDGL